MPNEFAHKEIDQVINQFHAIDTNNTGRLNLVDIVRYENQGPEQKQLGQFLERNVDSLSGISDFFSSGSAKTDLENRGEKNSHSAFTGAISLPDLQFADKLAVGDKDTVRDMRAKDVKDAAFDGGIKAGLLVAAPATVAAAMGMVPFAVGLEAVGAGGGAAINAIWENHYFNNKVAAVDAIK